MIKAYFLPSVTALLLFAFNSQEKADNVRSAGIAQVPTEVLSKEVTLIARPGAITFDVANAAVIVVDMQNDFGSKDGMFDRSGINITGIQETIEPIANVIAAARKSGIKIIYLKMGFKPDLSDLGREEYHKRLRATRKVNVGDLFTSPTGSQGRILVRDTWNTDIISKLQPQPNDIVMYKTRFSGFYQTPLDSILKKLEKKYLIFTGSTTSICIESTVRDAAFRDYIPIVLEDCTAEPIGNSLARTNHEASLLNIQLSFGWISNSNEFTKAITKLN
jgi:ureidoacrylate peracid hydrolase